MHVSDGFTDRVGTPVIRLRRLSEETAARFSARRNS